MHGINKIQLTSDHIITETGYEVKNVVLIFDT